MKKPVLAGLAILFLCIAPHTYGEGISVLDLMSEIKHVRLHWEPYKKIGVLSKGDTRVSFSTDLPWIMVNYSAIVSIEQPIAADAAGILRVSQQTAAVLRDIFKAEENRQLSSRVAVILIDPGHGGKDPGTIGTHTYEDKTITLKEKDIVLDIALKLNDLLVKAFPDKKILLTRNSDTYPSLEERVEVANKERLKPEEAILFVSLHVNASLNTKAKGYEVWYLPPDYRRTLLDTQDVEEEHKNILPILNSMLEEEYTVESVLLAKKILQGLQNQLGEATENRGLKAESWFVVRNAKMPSVLVEVGFITHPEEALLLADQKHLNSVALGIYNGLTDFIAYFEKTKGFTE